jgi:uncharacterized radical SAM superfamily Fe-S cluster-containing enzyme
LSLLGILRILAMVQGWLHTTRIDRHSIILKNKIPTMNSNLRKTLMLNKIGRKLSVTCLDQSNPHNHSNHKHHLDLLHNLFKQFTTNKRTFDMNNHRHVCMHAMQQFNFTKEVVCKCCIMCSLICVMLIKYSGHLIWFRKIINRVSI